MPTFRKTATIEARRFDPRHDIGSAQGVLDWCGGQWDDPKHRGDNYSAIIPTLEDGPDAQVKHYANPGDWIAKGAAGEFYPIKPDVMAATYEQVEP